jgi:hypothetical protein
MAIIKPKLPPNFVPENRLEELVIPFGKTSPEIDKEFYREFLKSDVITLGRPHPGQVIKEGYQRLEADTRVSVRLLEYKGEPIVAIYSSMKRMTDVIPEAYYRETGYIQLNCRTLLQIMIASDPQSKFVLNPGHMLVKPFSPEEVRVLLDGSIFRELEEARVRMTGPRNIDLPKGSEVVVGRPKVSPTSLMEKLAGYFQSTGDVEQAWVGQIQISSSGQPAHLLICLKLSKDSRRTFQQVTIDLGPVIRSSLGEKEFLDILDANAEAKMWITNLTKFFPR